MPVLLSLVTDVLLFCSVKVVCAYVCMFWWLHDVSVCAILLQTASGTVEAKVTCFYRRRDLSSALIALADKHHSKQTCDSLHMVWVIFSALVSQLRGHEFNYRLYHRCVWLWVGCSYASVTVQYNLVLVKGWWYSLAGKVKRRPGGKVTVALRWVVTCELTDTTWMSSGFQHL